MKNYKVWAALEIVLAIVFLVCALYWALRWMQNQDLYPWLESAERSALYLICYLLLIRSALARWNMALISRVFDILTEVVSGRMGDAEGLAKIRALRLGQAPERSRTR